MAFAETAPLVAVLDLKGNFAASLKKNQAALSSFSGAMGRVGKGVGQVGAGLARIGAIAGVAAAGGLLAAAKAGADWESQLNTINTIARATPDDLKRIGDGIRDLARQGRGDLADLSEGFYDILSAGITNTADAQKVLTSATTLAIGGLSTNAQAVDLLTTAINAYGQSASDAQADADLFAKAIELGKVTADEIAASFANVAPIAAQVGINIEEVTAAYAALTAQGTPAAEVATQMQRAIVELLSPTADLAELQDKLGVSFLQIAKDKGLVVALQAMRDGVGDNDEAFKALFGRVEAYKFALQTTGPQQKTYNAALEAMGRSAGTASAQMSERTQGLNFQLGRLKANLRDAGLTLAEGFLPALARTADRLSAFLGVEGNRNQLKQIGQDIGKALDGINWDAVLAGARAFYGVFKTIFDLVNALPTEIKAAGAAFLVLNKASGGLIGAGAGNIIGGIGAAAITGAASRTPGIGRIFAQPVFVTNWPLGGLAGGTAGAAAGKASSLLAAATKVFLVGAAVGTFAELKGILDAQSARNRGQIGSLTSQTTAFAGTASTADLTSAIRGISATQERLNTELSGAGLAFQLNIDGVRTAIESQKAILMDRLDRSERSVPPVTNVAVTVNVTAAQVAKSVVVQKRFGPPGGSRERGSTEFDV